VLIPVRMGVGLRLGVNGGYMKFTKKQNWIRSKRGFVAIRPCPSRAWG
jgi:hypothetical protein